MFYDLFNWIDQWICLVGYNCLVLLLFCFGGCQFFGVNVFKVQEVLWCLELFQVFGLFSQFVGVVDVCGCLVLVLDLGLVIGYFECEFDVDILLGYLVVIEFNCLIQGFLVSGVECIVNIVVEDIYLLLEFGVELSYLIVVICFQGELIQVIDVESVLVDIVQVRGDVVFDLVMVMFVDGFQLQVLVVDDLCVVCQQICSVLDQLGVGVILFFDGKQVFDYLLQIYVLGENLVECYVMVIFDIEMLVMDGYMLMMEIWCYLGLVGFYVLLYILLLGVFNNVMVECVGVNVFVVKYLLYELVDFVLDCLCKVVMVV